MLTANHSMLLAYQLARHTAPGLLVSARGAGLCVCIMHVCAETTLCMCGRQLCAVLGLHLGRETAPIPNIRTGFPSTLTLIGCAGRSPCIVTGLCNCLSANPGLCCCPLHCRRAAQHFHFPAPGGAQAAAHTIHTATNHRICLPCCTCPSLLLPAAVLRSNFASLQREAPKQLSVQCTQQPTTASCLPCSTCPPLLCPAPPCSRAAQHLHLPAARGPQAAPCAAAAVSGRHPSHLVGQTALLCCLSSSGQHAGLAAGPGGQAFGQLAARH